MTRTKGGFITKRNHKKIIKFNKGYKGAHSRLFKVANQESMHAFSYAYENRKKKKRMFKKLWIKEINAEARKNLMKYNELICILKKNRIIINKKILAKLSIIDKECFKKIIKL